MGKTINDILFSDMSHNSRVFRLHTKMNDSLMRYNEIIKGKQIGRIDNVKIPLEKKGYYGLNKGRDAGQDASSVAFKARPTPMANIHPTVKPIKLMQYLVRLITPPNGIVLDPFCGSGTTGIACKLEGFKFVGLEQDAEYCKIAQARIDNYVQEEVKQTKAEKKLKQIDLWDSVQNNGETKGGI